MKVSKQSSVVSLPAPEARPAPTVPTQSLATPSAPSGAAQRLVGADPAMRKDAAKPGASASQVRVRTPELQFSASPEALSQLLTKEVEEALEFAGKLQTAFTFFGGARVTEDDPFFARGKEWGEAVLLMNAAGIDPAAVSRAEASGLFSAQAVEAAKAAATGAMAGSFGALELGKAMAVRGSISPEGQSAAAADLALRDARPEDAKLLLSLTRTGAGPGMMEAVPLGYVDARSKAAKFIPNYADQKENLTTQGSRIQLPFEQETSPHIEQLKEFVHFLPRRLALTEKAAGFVVFPGGLGTLNELFEVWREGRSSVLDGKKFWGEFVDALKGAWEARGLVNGADLGKAQVVDSMADGLSHLVQTAPKNESTPAELKNKATQLAADIQSGLVSLQQLPPAVAVMGGRLLNSGDAEVKMAGDLAQRLTKSGIPMRVGGAGAVLESVSEGVRSSNKKMPVQAFVLESEGAEKAEVSKRADVAHVVHSAPAHKVLMYENTEAFVVLPGGIGTMDELFEVACLMQTGKIPVRPMILVGKEFWQPIMDAMERAMYSGERKLIGPDDMKLFTITDNPADAARLVRKHRAERESAQEATRS